MALTVEELEAKIESLERKLEEKEGDNEWRKKIETQITELEKKKEIIEEQEPEPPVVTVPVPPVVEPEPEPVVEPEPQPEPPKKKSFLKWLL